MWGHGEGGREGGCGSLNTYGVENRVGVQVACLSERAIAMMIHATAAASLLDANHLNE